MVACKNNYFQQSCLKLCLENQVQFQQLQEKGQSQLHQTVWLLIRRSKRNESSIFLLLRSPFCKFRLICMVKIRNHWVWCWQQRKTVNTTGLINRWACASCSRHQFHSGQTHDACAVPAIIKYMQTFQRADWLRARQLIPNSAESWNWVQKVEIKLIDRKVAKP